MDNVKVNLSVTFKGRVLLSKEECLKTTQKEIIRKRKNGQSYKKVIDIQVEDLDKMDKSTIEVADSNGRNKEVLTIYTRKCVPARQSINLTNEAYKFMIDKKEVPYWTKAGAWASMSNKQRLESHLKNIMEHLGGVSYTYVIFDD